MDQFPWSAKSFCRSGQCVFGIVVLVDAMQEISSLADIEFPVRIPQDVDVPTWGVGDHEFSGMAPEVGFEPTTNRLTADRSTTELLWIVVPAD